MIRLWRSAKCPGTSRQRSTPDVAGSPQSTAMATSQSATFSSGPTNDAATSSATTTPVATASPITQRRSAGSSRDAHEEQRDVAQAHDAVGHGEPQATVAEGLRDGEGHHQQGDHHQQHDDPDGPLLGVDEAGQPGEAHPRPPHDGQDHERRAGARPTSGRGP